MNEKFSGKVWVLGDDIDTDIIIPTEYLALKTVEDMKPYAFSPLRPELAGQITSGGAKGQDRRSRKEVVERLLFDRIDGKSRRSPISR